MTTKQEIAKLLVSADRKGLQQLSRRMPFDQFLKVGHEAYLSLRPDQQRAARDIRDIYEMDRLDGMLMLLTEKEMPAQACLASAGSGPNEYDKARTFLLNNLRPMGIPGNFKPTEAVANFYPELKAGSVVERLMTLARKHDNLDPKDDRQTNLVSCSGRYNYVEAQSLVQRSQGTTCAVFLRALLDAAGDPRIQRVPGAFNYYPGMPKALGCFDNGSGGPTGNGWVSGDQLKSIKRGDLYFVRDNAAGGSGHVGIIRTVAIKDGLMTWSTYDGGQGSPGIWFRKVPVRTFHNQPGQNDKCPWLQSHPGKPRRLQGIVKIPGLAKNK
jgi:hypothetical protein